jgi:acyl-CoA synthetase (NDP forming)/GNAT superfamily N-acetyltransferase
MTTAAADPVRSLLLDGRVVTIRPVRPDDGPALLDLHRRLSERSRYLRFFSLGDSPAEEFVRQLVSCAPGGCAVVAELAGELVGVANHARPGRDGLAEVALAIADPEQSHGLGTLLLEHLISAAHRNGIRGFSAEVLTENAKVMRVFTDLGLPIRVDHLGPELHVELTLDPDERYLDALADRERRADVSSLSPLLKPASIAVVGAGRRAGTVGHAVLANLVTSGFPGAVYPVNPHAAELLGRRAYPSVTDLPEAPDLAVVCVPAAAVGGVAEDCGRRGVRALAVLTAGITGVPEYEERLRDAVALYGMRLVGPNCLGLASSGPAAGFDATFARTVPGAGPVGVVSQSGGVGIALLEQLDRIGVGVSSFVSVGDKYDVSGNDLMRWWEADPATRVGVLYVESFGNPRKFARVARRLSATMPLIAVRSGSSAAAQRAAASHTAATTTPAVTRDALYRQAGVIAVDGLTDATAAIAVLTCGPRPAGRRMAVVSNAGGAGVIAADACAAAGLELPTLSAATRDRLAALLPGAAATANPVDTTAGVDAATFAAALDAVLADEAVDGVLAISAPTALADLVPAITAAAGSRPLLAVRLDQAAAVTTLPASTVDTSGAPPAAGSGGPAADQRLAAFADPGVAAWAYARAARYAAWCEEPRGVVPALAGIDPAAARAAIRGALRAEPGGCWLDPDATAVVLRAFGIPVPEATVVTGPDQAAAAAARSGGPVVLKAVVPGLTHKSDRGGVLLDLAGPDAARDGYRRLAATFGHQLAGVLVQPMLTGGVELLAGVVSDPEFGPLVVLGAGGTGTDLLDDRAYRLTPLTDRDAGQLVTGLRCSPLLTGYRGGPPTDTAALRDVLLRVGRLADTLPEVCELDLNPLLVRPDGCNALDARIRVAPRELPDRFLRRLR